MKKVLSLVLTLAVAGMVGLTAGCKKKAEAPKTEQAPATQPAEPAQPAQPAGNESAPQPEQQAPAEKPAEQPAEKK